MATLNKPAGQLMRAMRYGKGLNMRDVHRLSKQIAKSAGNPDYVVAISRLSDIERNGHTPNLYRLHCLALIYHCSIRKLLRFYGMN